MLDDVGCLEALNKLANQHLIRQLCLAVWLRPWLRFASELGGAAIRLMVEKQSELGLLFTTQESFINNVLFVVDLTDVALVLRVRVHSCG